MCEFREKHPGNFPRSGIGKRIFALEGEVFGLHSTEIWPPEVVLGRRKSTCKSEIFPKNRQKTAPKPTCHTKNALCDEIKCEIAVMAELMDDEIVDSGNALQRHVRDTAHPAEVALNLDIVRERMTLSLARVIQSILSVGSQCFS